MAFNTYRLMQELLRVQAVLKIILCEEVRWNVTRQFLAVVIDYAAEPDSHSGYTPPISQVNAGVELCKEISVGSLSSDRDYRYV